MAHPNSVAAYRQGIENGNIETMQARFYAMLKRHDETLPDPTANEVSERVRAFYNIDAKYDLNGCARFKELKDAGLVVVTGRRPCSLSKTIGDTYAPADRPGVVPVMRERPIVAKLTKIFTEIAGDANLPIMIDDGDVDDAVKLVLAIAKELEIKL